MNELEKELYEMIKERRDKVNKYKRFLKTWGVYFIIVIILLIYLVKVGVGF